jgi:hypothetical protein
VILVGFEMIFRRQLLGLKLFKPGNWISISPWELILWWR